MPDRIEIDGAAELEKRLAMFEATIRDLRSFWPSVVPLFIKWMRQQFETEGAFMGTPWAPLTARYAAWKGVHYPGKGLLYAEGDLRRGASLPQRDAGPTHLTLSIGWPKAGENLDPDWHQSGTSKMVARPLLAEHLPPEAQDDLERAATDYVTDNARRFGLLASR